MAKNTEVKEDTRSVIAKFTDSRKFMTATLVNAVTIATNTFFDLGVAPRDLWYGCVGIYVIVLILWTIEKIMRIKYPGD